MDVGKTEKLACPEMRSTCKIAPNIDVEKYVHALWGVNLMTIFKCRKCSECNVFFVTIYLLEEHYPPEPPPMLFPLL